MSNRTKLQGKRILVTGVLNDASIAFSVARRAQQEGADVVLTSFGRAMSLTQRAARRLPTEPPIIELDVTDTAHLDTLTDRVGGRLDGIDGRLDGIDGRLAAHDGRFDRLDESLAEILRRLPG